MLAAMTRWEPLDAQTAAGRIQEAGRRADLLARIGPPPPTFDFPLPPTAFTGALANLSGAPLSVRHLAFRGAMELAIGSGCLPLEQHLALRTVSDALGFGQSELSRAFADRTGAALPQPWDPGRKSDWQRCEPPGPGPGGPSPASGSELEAGRIARIKALALLGLEEEANDKEVKRAYLRVSRVHHPDHYASLGPMAAQEAELAFRRIKKAYEFLTRTKS